jgi:hypothetical protein
MNTTAANLIIDRLGGTSETARLFEIKPPSVSEWRKNGIPKARLLFLRVARPDVLANLPAAPQRRRAGKK